MPQVTVYIREGDIDKWKALEHKAEFIHKALNSQVPTETRTALDAINPVLQTISAQPPSPNRETTPFSDMPLACCLAKKPCIHWVWDGAESQYTNSRTGEVRSVDF